MAPNYSGNQCWAFNYKGKCDPIQKDIQTVRNSWKKRLILYVIFLEKMSVSQRQSWEKTCEGSWPCMPLVCPKGVDWDQ